MRPRITFGNSGTFGSKDQGPEAQFHAALKARVERYFAERGLEKTANAAMIAKSAFWLTARR